MQNRVCYLAISCLQFKGTKSDHIATRNEIKLM